MCFQRFPFWFHDISFGWPKWQVYLSFLKISAAKHLTPPSWCYRHKSAPRSWYGPGVHQQPRDSMSPPCCIGCPGKKKGLQFNFKMFKPQMHPDPHPWKPGASTPVLHKAHAIPHPHAHVQAAGSKEGFSAITLDHSDGFIRAGAYSYWMLLVSRVESDRISITNHRHPKTPRSRL